MRDYITFDAGHERKDPKIILWVKVWAIYDSNSEGNYGNTTVELQNHDKMRGGYPSPH